MIGIQNQLYNEMVYLVDEYIHIHPFFDQQYNPDDKERSFSIISFWPESRTDIQHSYYSWSQMTLIKLYVFDLSRFLYVLLE